MVPTQGGYAGLPTNMENRSWLDFAMIPVREMIYWYLRNPQEGQSLAADDPKMVAIQAYITYERRSVKLEPGKH